MRVGVEVPHLTGINGGQLGIQHDLIDFALWVGKAARDRPRACDVAGIATEFCAGVNQNDFIVPADVLIRCVVKNRGVLTTTHDGGYDQPDAPA